MRLTRKEQRHPSQSRKRKTTVSARKATPGILHDMAVGIGTDVNTDELIDRSVEGGIAAGEEVRAGSADGVLEDVGEEGGED